MPQEADWMRQTLAERNKYAINQAREIVRLESLLKTSQSRLKTLQESHRIETEKLSCEIEDFALQVCDRHSLHDEAMSDDWRDLLPEQRVKMLRGIVVQRVQGEKNLLDAEKKEKLELEMRLRDWGQLLDQVLFVALSVVAMSSLPDCVP